jgi:enoyl-CoA hydratase/carnithine racemase
MPDFIRVYRVKGVTTITLNRPGVMNAINPEMHLELERAFDEFASDAEQQLCVITGAGDRAFCAGSDLKAGARDRGFSYSKHGYAGVARPTVASWLTMPPAAKSAGALRSVIPGEWVNRAAAKARGVVEAASSRQHP